MPRPNSWTGNPHISLIEEIVNEFINNINTIAAAQIVSYNKETGRCSAKLLNKLVLESVNEEGNPTHLEVPPVDNVPVAFFGSPSLNVTNEPKVGDIGLLLCCQRSFDEAKAAATAEPENPEKIQVSASRDSRKFDINDALFFPIYLNGNKQFQGIKTKGSETEIGVTNNKVKIKGKEQNLTEIVSDLASQVEKNRESIRAVAASNPWTAPSLAAVGTNEIISKIKSALSYIKQRISFEEPALTAIRGALEEAGLKAIGLAFDPETGDYSIERQNPDELIRGQEAFFPRIEVSFNQRHFEPVDEFVEKPTIFGWSLRGLFDFYDFFPFFGVGDADFSPLKQIDKRFNSEWNEVVSCLIEGDARRKMENPTKLYFFWLKEARLGGIRRIRGFVYDFKQETEILIGVWPVPETDEHPLEITSLASKNEKSLYVEILTNDINDQSFNFQEEDPTDNPENDQGKFSRRLGTEGGALTKEEAQYLYSTSANTFGSLFGSENDLVYRNIILRFYDENDEPFKFEEPENN